VRRLLLAALLAGVTASAALGAPRGANDRIACEDVKAVDLLFWPHGHGVIPVFGPNSAFPTPHMEIYRAGVTANSGFLGFVGTTSWNLSPGCRTVELKTSQLSTGGSRLQITVGHTGAAVVDASIRDTGSRIIYRTKFCKRIALLPGSTSP
jgi:hypothetical protein